MARFFISYSHADEVSKDRLLTHCANLRREGNHFWEDRRLRAGDELDPAIIEALENADFIILLVSADFLASYYCYEVEFQTAITRHQKGEARVISVILDHCDWKATLLTDIVNLPRDANPITDWQNPNQAWQHVVEEIRRLLGPDIDSSNLAPSKTPLATPGKADIPPLPEVPRTITDQDIRKCLRKTFSDLLVYFSKGIDTLNQQGGPFTAEFLKIHEQRFVASLYKNGNLQHEIVFWVGGMLGRNSISYHLGRNISLTSENTFSGCIRIEEDNGHLAPKLEAYAIANRPGSDKSPHEALWHQFVEPMARR